jgi:hypothetical protein
MVRRTPATQGAEMTQIEEAREIDHDAAIYTPEIVDTYPRGSAALRTRDAEIEALKAKVMELSEKLKPRWFYHPDYSETCEFGIWDVIDRFDLPPGKHVVEINCAVPLPSIWASVHVLTDEEKDTMETNEAWIVTEHATEDEACIATALGENNERD